MSLINRIKAKSASEITVSIVYGLSFVITGALISYLLFSNYMQITDFMYLAIFLSFLWQLICVFFPDNRKFINRFLNYLFHLAVATEIVIAINFSGIFDNEKFYQMFGSMILYRDSTHFLWDGIIMLLILCIGYQSLYFVITRALKKKYPESGNCVAAPAEIKGRKITKFKILITMLIVAVISIGTATILWVQHVKVFEPFLRSEKLEQIKIDSISDPEFIEVDGIDFPIPVMKRYSYWRGGWFSGMGDWEEHRYRDYGPMERGFSYDIYIPTYLRFGGGIQIFRQTEDDIITSIYITPEDMSISLLIDESWRGGDSAAVYIDKYGHPLPIDKQHPDDIEARYALFMILYDKYNDLVVEAIEAMNEAFGDALR